VNAAAEALTGGAPPVAYRSRGALLVAGPAAVARACAARLAGPLRCTLLLDDEEPARDELGGRLEAVEGHLGAFRVEAWLHGEGRAVDLAERAGEAGGFDLVLDLNEMPCLERSVPPPGYFAPANEAALEEALAALPELVGEFDKPRYFHYDASLCAHGDSGQTGCTHCLAACGAQAIRSAGDTIRIDPYLCQGCGACSTACPTGAVSYDYPGRARLVETLRRQVHAARAQTDAVTVLLHDGETPPAPANEALVALELEDCASAGIEVWLAALAFGAGRVLIGHGPGLPAESRRVLDEQLGYARAILDGLQLPAASLARIDSSDTEALERALAGAVASPLAAMAEFAGLDDKRAQLRLAIAHLHRASGSPATETPLPAGAPFGAIAVDREACTLCMTCAGVCPAQALQAGGEQPALRFIEQNCVQCGLCESACPEDAIALQPRLLFDEDAARGPRTLNQAETFACIACGKPFATAKMIETILGRLADHWMFQDERARERLKMCEDCRVRDAAAGGASGP